jgi:hypothetical protein
MLTQAHPVRLTAAATFLSASLASAPSQGQEAGKAQTAVRAAEGRESKPDPVWEPLRREAEAKAREHEAAFRRLKDLTPSGDPAGVVVREVGPAVGGGVVVRQAVQVAPAAPPAPVVVQQGVVVMAANQPERYLATYRPILRAEYQLLVTVCEPSRDQRRAIARSGEEALRSAAEEYAKWATTPRRVVNGVLEPQPPNFRRIIREGIAAAAAAELTPEVLERYATELARRAEDERRTGAMNIVVKLDQAFDLSERQREELTEALVKGWVESWAPALAGLTADNDAYPMVPDALIGPVLTAGQKQVWSGLRKFSMQGTTGLGLVVGAPPAEGPLEDAEPGDGPEARPREDRGPAPPVRVP